MPQAWTEVFPQIFGGREVQTMWQLLKNEWSVWRSMFQKKDPIQIGLTYICYNRSECKIQAIEYKHLDSTIKDKLSENVVFNSLLGPDEIHH